MFAIRADGVQPGPDVGGCGGGPWPLAVQRGDSQSEPIILPSNKDTRVCVCVQTFFADELVGGGADVVVELPRLDVVHPPDVHAVLLVLPVVRLVGPPWEEVLRGETASGVPRAQPQAWRGAAALAYRWRPVCVGEGAFSVDVVQADPGRDRHVACRGEQRRLMSCNMHSNTFLLCESVKVL